MNESGWEQVDFVSKSINMEDVQIDKTERLEVGNSGWIYRTIVKVERPQRDEDGAEMGHEVRAVAVALCFVPKR